ncbi:MAG: hypothetical protein M3Z24_03270, partial [Chloroflexota bacterium]|nr:hypothetical protein [Chloroflexota bacterium]
MRGEGVESVEGVRKPDPDQGIKFVDQGTRVEFQGTEFVDQGTHKGMPLLYSVGSFPTVSGRTVSCIVGASPC